MGLFPVGCVERRRQRGQPEDGPLGEVEQLERQRVEARGFRALRELAVRSSVKCASHEQKVLTRT